MAAYLSKDRSSEASRYPRRTRAATWLKKKGFKSGALMKKIAENIRHILLEFRGIIEKIARKAFFFVPLWPGI